MKFDRRQAFDEVPSLLSDLFQVVLENLPLVWCWLKSLVSLNAVIWFGLGLLTLPIIGGTRSRIARRRVKSRLHRRVQASSTNLVSPAMRLFSGVYPKTSIELLDEETDNILEILANVIEIASTNPENDWSKLWSEVDPSWRERFVSKCRIVREPSLQQAFAKAFALESVTPGRFDPRIIDSLAEISSKDWKTFTAICSFSCRIDGRVTPVIFNFEDDVYRRFDLGDEALDTLIAAGLVTKGGYGDTYTLQIPDKGLTVRYIDSTEIIVRPLPSPIPRDRFGRKVVESHELDTRLNVGVIDFTELGRALGFLTPCAAVEGFADYLKLNWRDYV